MQGHRKVQTTGRELPGTTVTRRSPASPLPLLLSSSPTIPCVPGQPCGGRCDPIPGDRHTDPDTTHTTAHYFSLHPVDGVSHRSSSAQPATLNLCVNIINTQRQHNTFFFFFNSAKPYRDQTRVLFRELLHIRRKRAFRPRLLLF